MLYLFLITFISLLIGGMLGHYLAGRGVTADNALERYQNYVIWIVLFIALLVLGFLLVGRFQLTHLIPLIVRLYIGGHLTDVVLMGGTFSQGLLLGLELPGHHSSKRMIQLGLALVIISAPLFILLHYAQPITGLLGSPKVVDNVVLQTTDFTCAPASIATLGRWLGSHPELSEEAVTKMARTNRLGTSILSEIRTLKKLGFEIEFQEKLTVADLIQRNQPALLHVKENIGGVLMDHAVALLSIEPKRQSLIIANPIDGIQEMTTEAMNLYWRQEAIFVKIRQD